jgi:hypothetical protein
MSFLLLLGRVSSPLLDFGDGMSSGAGEVLVEERREDGGEMYVWRLAND